MTALADWLRAQMKECGLNQTSLSARSGVAAGTLNDILHRDHIPKIETLFRLADALEASHMDILLASGHLRRGDTLPGARTEPPDPEAEAKMEGQLVEEFRMIPAEAQADALTAFRVIARLTKRPRFRVIGEEEPEAKG